MYRNQQSQWDPMTMMYLGGDNQQGANPGALLQMIMQQLMASGKPYQIPSKSGGKGMGMPQSTPAGRDFMRSINQPMDMTLEQALGPMPSEEDYMALIGM